MGYPEGVDLFGLWQKAEELTQLLGKFLNEYCPSM